MTWHQWHPALEEVDQQIAEGISADHLRHYPHQTLVYIAQKANIEANGLNTVQLINIISEKANFILPSAIDWDNEE